MKFYPSDTFTDAIFSKSRILNTDNSGFQFLYSAYAVITVLATGTGMAVEGGYIVTEKSVSTN
ncbi:MAG: hypothetical protein GKR95_05775 [Gammaproteobacteria bacterium]|nr:hypothetical protein [Gammaproteobacteria bacterium]